MTEENISRYAPIKPVNNLLFFFIIKFSPGPEGILVAPNKKVDHDMFVSKRIKRIHEQGLSMKITNSFLKYINELIKVGKRQKNYLIARSVRPHTAALIASRIAEKCEI